MPRHSKPAQSFADGPRPAIPLEPIEDEQISAVGYSAEAQEIAVTFKSKGMYANPVYHTPGVTPEVYAELRKADSFHDFYRKHIKPLPFHKYRGEAAE